jgi:hypothetical protein
MRGDTFAPMMPVVNPRAESVAPPAALEELPSIPTGDPAAAALDLLAAIAPGRAIADLELELKRVDQQAGSDLTRLAEVIRTDGHPASQYRHATPPALASAIRGVIPLLIRHEEKAREYNLRLKRLGAAYAVAAGPVHRAISEAIRRIRPDMAAAAAESIRAQEAAKLPEIERRIRSLVDAARRDRGSIHHDGWHQDQWLELAAAAIRLRTRALKAARPVTDPVLSVVELLSA